MYRSATHVSAVVSSPVTPRSVGASAYAIRVVAWVLAAGGLGLGTACTPETIDLTLNATLDDVQVSGDAAAGAAVDRDRDESPSGDGSVRGANPGNNLIQDGTSNTIQIGESGAPDDEVVSPERPDASDSSDADDAAAGGGAPADDAGGAGAGGAPQQPAPDEAEIIRVLTQDFANKFFEFGRSAGNSDNDAFVTGTNELTLCANGRFFLREQFSFSGDVNFLPDPDDSIGTWAIVVREDGVPAVELRIEQTTATSQAPILQFALGVDDAGNLFMNGARVFTIQDATGDCQ